MRTQSTKGAREGERPLRTLPAQFLTDSRSRVAIQALRLVAENQEMLLEKWKEIHGG